MASSDNSIEKKGGLRQKILTLKKTFDERHLFVASTSHEIRTPIQTILTVMDLLEDTKLDAEQTEYTRQIRFSAQAILALVNDILDFSKLELGKMKFESYPFNLSDVVEDTIDLISMEAHKKGLEVLIDVDVRLPAFIIGDANRLRQVILNLVKNAVKFTSKGSVACIVSLSSFQRSDFNNGEVTKQVNKPCILFEIKDTGIGLPKENRDKLFSYFYQTEVSTARKYGGTGLGLPICKNIVEVMKGCIGVRDNEEGGSVFYFKIPIIQAKIPSSYENMLLSPSAKILICDDNPSTLKVIKEMLIKFGFSNITTAENGEEALQIIQKMYEEGSFFDIAFIDMIMPKMDGWRLVAEITKFIEPLTTALYLMIPEGTLTTDAKMKLLEWFDGYVYKPIKRRVMFTLLNDFYRKRLSEDADDIGMLESIKGEYTADVEELQKKEGKEEKEGKTIERDSSTLPFAERSSDISHQGKTFSKTKNEMILVVDDHPVNKQLLRIVLEKSGYQVLTAEDGLDAINKVKENKFDLIFMDVQMPILDGYEATKKIREAGYKMPIIACTAGSRENEKDIALSFGMNDVLSKPFTREDLSLVLNRNLKGEGKN